MTGGHRRLLAKFALATSAGVLALTGVAACGHKGNPIQIVQQPGDDGTNGAGGANSAFLTCLRDHGVTIPSGRPSGFPRPSGSRRPRPSGQPRPSGPRPSGSFRRPGGFFPTDIPSACASLRPSFGGGFRNPGGPAASPSTAG